VREGELLGPGGEGSWDSQGVGTRCVVPWRGRLLMVYEGVEAGTGTHRLGAAASDDGGLSFSKLPQPPLLVPGGAGGEWTAQVVGTPYAVALPGGALRLFFCAKPNAERGGMCIGALDSPSGELDAAAWGPAGATAVGSRAYLQGMVESPLDFRSDEVRLPPRPRVEHRGATPSRPRIASNRLVRARACATQALDNITPNLKLVAGATGVTAVLVGAFLASNGAL
jgi:hypothetical protein